MGNTVPPRASSREEATGGRRSENVVVVTEAAPPPATPSRRVVTTARKQGRDDDGGGGVALAAAGKVLTVKIVMTRKDAEALVARLKLKAQSARERKARMAQLKGELRAGSCGGAGGANRDDARIRPMLPPIKEENRFERITPVV